MERQLDGTVCFQNTLLRMRPRSTTDPRFLAWWNRHAYDDGLYASLSTGANIHHLSAERVRSVPVTFPDAYEQRAIADFLDAETARIDSLISRKLRLLEIVEQREWTWRSMLVVGADSADVDSVAELGKVSSGFPIRRLRQVVPDIGVGVVVNPSTYFADEGVPFIHGSNVKEGWIDLTAVKRMSANDSAKLTRSRLSPGDVLVVRAGYPGRAAVVPSELEGANCASVLVIRRSREVLPAFLAAFFNSAPARQLWKHYRLAVAHQGLRLPHSTLPTIS